MTADDVRGELAAALRDWTGAWTPAERRELIDALLPVVDEIAGKRAAKELRAAADAVDITGGIPEPWRGLLRRRAAALDAEAGS